MSPDEANETPRYTLYHPRWYRTRVSTYWWLHQWSYLKFVLRELSSIFVAYFVLITLLEIRALAHGPESFAGFQKTLANPFVLAANVITFFFVLLHTITWFNLAPRAMAVRVGGKRVPDLLIATINYVVWFVISGIVAWALLRN